MSRQNLPSIDSFWLGGWESARDARLAIRSASTLHVQQARDVAWWRQDKLPNRYWPLYTASSMYTQALNPD